MASRQLVTERDFTSTDGTTHFYLAAGPEQGPLLIFVHGWPGVAQTWQPQLIAFAALGFRVVAPDTRGYGRSTVSREAHDYGLERLVTDQLALLAHLQRSEAVWIGHDWGSGIVWALAAHHPEVCVGVINLCVPYRTVELGLQVLLPTVNRSIYPANDYPYGQWDYQHFYEQNSEQAIKVLNANPANSAKCFFLPGNPAMYGAPARTSTITRDGGWFGGATEAPNIPLSRTVLDETLFTTLKDSLTRNGWFAPTAYYLNHDANHAYGEKSVNGGVLDIPVLFIEARYDAVCATSLSSVSAPMRKYCPDLTECSIEAGH